jgi:N-acetylated-alpha-linked acidic dipeptidase
MEEARSISELLHQGWKPARTIVYTVWDGEEPGLLGSTEWAETHADELRQKAAVYVNTDGNERGFLGVGGSHTLERFVNEVAGDLPDPETRQSVAQRWRAQRLLKAAVNDRKEIRDRSDLRIEALGSGSDYTPFLQHLGIASLNLGYSGEGEGGSYHSIYDSFDHYTRFCDPDFEYETMLVRTCGRIILRLADSQVLPYEFSGFSDTVEKYVTEVMKLAEDVRTGTVETNRLISERILMAAADPKHAFVEPKPKPEVPFLNFAPLQNALADLQRSAQKFEETRRREGSPSRGPELDKALAQLEGTLLHQEGLPRRPWYKHLIYAPGFYTGYGVKTLPGVREAIEQQNWEEATLQIQLVASVLEKFTAQLDHCTELFEHRR